MLTNSLPDRFWSKVITGPDHECWPWVGSIVGGYGQFRHNGKVRKAHRLAYENRWGTIPDELVVMHTCDNRACVNVLHLQLGTLKDNNRDRDNKGRHVALKGQAHGMAKLTEAGIREIRALQLKQAHERKQLAEKLAISSSTVYDVMIGKTWKWLE